MLVVALAGCGRQNAPMEQRHVVIAEQEFVFDVARTPDEQRVGLARYEALPGNRGMLFVYEQPITPSFWMKGMRFPIDIVWLRDGRVVGVEANVTADDGASHYVPTQPVDAVLELGAGQASQLGISRGSVLAF